MMNMSVLIMNTLGSGAFSFLDEELLINAFNLNDYAKFIKC